MEQQIELDYLERLADAYVEHFDSYGGAPVFAIDAGSAISRIMRNAQSSVRENCCMDVAARLRDSAGRITVAIAMANMPNGNSDKRSE